MSNDQISSPIQSPWAEGILDEGLRCFLWAIQIATGKLKAAETQLSWNEQRGQFDSTRSQNIHSSCVSRPPNNLGILTLLYDMTPIELRILA